jgi:transposase-like protein
MDERETIRQLQEQNEQLKHENELLKAKICELEARLVLHNINFAIFDNAFGVCLWHCPF